MRAIMILKTVLLLNVASAFSQNAILCDTATFNSIINKHIRYIDKKSKIENYFILTNIYPDKDSSKNFPFLLCDTLVVLNPASARQGKFVNEYKNTNVPLYCFHSVKTNTVGDIRLIVSVSIGEWGGSTMSYTYKKKRNSWKLVKKSLISIS
jgi:hypothetical protein